MKRLILVVMTAMFTLTGVNAFCQEPPLVNEVQIMNLAEWDYVNHQGFKIVATTSGYVPDEQVEVYFHIDNITKYNAGEPPYEGTVQLFATIGEDSPEECLEISTGDIPTSIVSVGALCSGSGTAIDRFTIIIDVEGIGFSPGDILLPYLVVFTANNDATVGFPVIVK